MTILQEKSECCAAKIVRFGGKRRQCTACKKTWRVHPAKRGRKVLRKSYSQLKKIFNHGFTVKQSAGHSRLSAGAAYKRFGKALLSIIGKKRVIRIKGQKLILLIDAQWQYFNDELWTLYFLSVKAVSSQSVVVFDPTLRAGKENIATWNQVIDGLPRNVRKRVVAMVSDGIRGIETTAADNGWVIQRCHFHLLSLLQKMRGKRAATPGRVVREEIYNSVKLALSEKSNRRLNILCRRLAALAKDPLCPKRMRMITRDFLRRLYEFRSYLEHPDLKLPTTINVMESINSYTRKKSKPINNPYSWHRWAIAGVRFKSKFICK